MIFYVFLGIKQHLPRTIFLREQNPRAVQYRLETGKFDQQAKPPPSLAKPFHPPFLPQADLKLTGERVQLREELKSGERE